MIKSLTRPMLVTLALTVLICWLFTQSRRTKNEQYDNFSQLLTMVSRLDAEINAEVLKLEFHMHESYDGLTQLEQNFKNCFQEIEQYAELAYDGQTVSQQPLLAPLNHKLSLTSEFKSLHAVLENSVAIFFGFSQKLSDLLDRETSLGGYRSDLLRLQKAGIELVHSPNQQNRERLQKCLEQLSTWHLDADSQAEQYSKVMLAHAQNLLKARPQMDQLLHDLNRLSVPQSLQAMHDKAARVHESANQQAAVYHVQLLCATLLLIGYCGYSIFHIGHYVNTIRQANEQLEERVQLRTKEIESKSEALRSNGRFLASILDAMDAKICILDAEGTINATNAGWNASSSAPEWIGSGVNYLRSFTTPDRTVLGAPEVAVAIEEMRCTQARTGIVEYATTSEKRQWIQARINKMPNGPDRFLGFVVALIDVTQRVLAEEDKDKLNRQLQAMSRQAGMAEIATGVLHNVGNVLNSINIASSQATRIVRTSRLASLQKAEQLIKAHQADFGTFVTADPRGRQLPNYISQIARTWEEEQVQLLTELDDLTRHIEHVKHVINIQQEHAKLSTVNQDVQLPLLIEDAISTLAPALKTAGIELVRDWQPLPRIHSDPHKIMQILVNLLSNAKHALQDSMPQQPKIVVSSAVLDDCIRLSVTDNGIGISPENLARICQHGFTTKKNGHGFGLHSCALLAKQLGGSLQFDSPGLNQGATFTLNLPGCRQQDATAQASGQGVKWPANPELLAFKCGSCRRKPMEELWHAR